MTSEKAKRGRPSIACAKLVEDIAVEIVKKWCLDNVDTLRLSLQKNPRYVDTLAKSERVLIQSRLVRNAMRVDKWIEENHSNPYAVLPETIAYQMFLAARQGRDANRKTYAAQEADPVWIATQMARVQAYRTADGKSLYYSHYEAYRQARDRLEGNAPPLDMSKLDGVTKPPKKPRASRKLLPEVEDVYGDDDVL